MNNLMLKALRSARLFISTSKQFTTRLLDTYQTPGHQPDSDTLGLKQSPRVTLPGPQAIAENPT